MARWRWGFLVFVALVVYGSATSVRATHEPLWICCSDSDDCGGKETCCPPELVANIPCSGEHGGYCMPVCVWIGGR
jgi:hypothetical protein